MSKTRGITRDVNTGQAALFCEVIPTRVFAKVDVNVALFPNEIHSWTKSRAIRACEKSREVNGQNYCHAKTCCSS